MGHLSYKVFRFLSNYFFMYAITKLTLMAVINCGVRAKFADMRWLIVILLFILHCALKLVKTRRGKTSSMHIR